jgi:hypothetical protein
MTSVALNTTLCKRNCCVIWGLNSKDRCSGIAWPEASQHDRTQILTLQILV